MPRQLFSILLPLLLVLLSASAGAQVSAQPSALYLTPERGEADIALSNTTGTALQLHVAALDRTEADGVESGAGSCAAWCTLAPAELPLPSDGAVTLHVRVIPPGGLRDGEYHAVVLIRDDEDVLQRIPLHFRVGDVYSDVKLANVGVERSKEDVRFLLYLEQLGNAAYRGNLQMRIENDRRDTIYESADLVDVYGAKTLEYVLPAAKVRKGIYRLYLNFDSDREDLGAHAIPVLPKKFSVEISMS